MTGKHRLDQELDGRPDHGADDQWATELAAMRTTLVIYDGRISDRCQETCQAGECGHPMTVDGCGGCCGCRGGCAEGYEEQLAEQDTRCRMELCPNWSGDGNVCPCAVFGLRDQAERDRSTTSATSTEGGAPC